MTERGLRVTLNTDDPGVMGNRYLSEVMEDAAFLLGFDHRQVAQLSRNAFTSLWVPDEKKSQYLALLSDYESARV